MANEKRIVMKLCFEGNFRRINLEERPLSIGEVQRAVSQLFPSQQAVQLTYTDEDGDKITVSTDLELEEAYNVASETSNASIIRLNVERKDVDFGPHASGSLLCMSFIGKEYMSQQAEEARKQAEEEKRRAEEEKKRLAEEEEARLLEENLQKMRLEAQQKEEEKRRAEEEKKRLAEKEMLLQKMKLEAQQKEEKARLAEEAARREAQRKAEEEEALRIEKTLQDAKRAFEEDKKEELRKAAEEARKKEAEEKKEKERQQYLLNHPARENGLITLMSMGFESDACWDALVASKDNIAGALDVLMS